jgi:hypothetical protein
MSDSPLPVDPATRNLSLYGGVLGLLVFGGIGFYFALNALSILYSVHQAQNYVAFPGYVENVRRYSVRSKNRGSTTYHEVRYKYIIRGKQYESDRATFPWVDTVNGELADRAQQAWKNQSPITVWVDPSNPKRSVLDRTVSAGDILPSSCIGFLFASIGYWGLYLQLSYFRPTQPNSFRALPLRRNLKWRAVYVLWGAALILPVTIYFMFVLGSATAVFPLMGAAFCVHVLVGLLRKYAFYKRIGNIEVRLTKRTISNGYIDFDVRVEKGLVFDKLELRLSVATPNLTTWCFSRKDFQSFEVPNGFRTSFEFPLKPDSAPLASQLKDADNFTCKLEVSAFELGHFPQKLQLELESIK